MGRKLAIVAVTQKLGAGVGMVDTAGDLPQVVLGIFESLRYQIRAALCITANLYIASLRNNAYGSLNSKPRPSAIDVF